MKELIEIIDSLGFWIYFPIIMLVTIPVMRYVLRLGSDDDDDDDDDDKESVASKVIPRRNVSVGRLTGMTMMPKQRREKYGKVVSGLYREDHDPNIIKHKVKIQSNNNPEPILCPNCNVSVMTQWKKCYHCGELL